jgi:deoxyribose-phosphate aldolase
MIEAPTEGSGLLATGVAARIQSTRLGPEVTREDVERLLEDCVQRGFHAAVVSPIWIPLAVRTLEGTDVRVCTALDFPLGGDTTATVTRAAAEARRAGAHEIDVMTKVGWLKSKMDVAYRQHLAAVVKAAGGAPVKAVLETALLTRHEIALAVELCADAGVAYAANSTDEVGGEATRDQITELTKLARGRMKVKASGGIRSLEQAAALMAAGADLVGTSSIDLTP